MFRWAAAEETIPPLTAHALTTVSAIRRGEPGVRETPKVRPAPEAHVGAALPHMPPAVAAMVRLPRATGMRPYEVCVLRGCDLDRSGPVWVYVPMHHKKEHLDHDRPVYIGPKGQAVLADWLPSDPAAFAFSPAREKGARFGRMRAARRTKAQPSQASRKRASPKKVPGPHYSPDSYRQAIAKACAKAGVPAWAPNRLRHSAATEFRAAFGIEVTRVLLGHSSVKTSEIYAEQDAAAARAAALKAGWRSPRGCQSGVIEWRHPGDTDCLTNRHRHYHFRSVSGRVRVSAWKCAWTPGTIWATPVQTRCARRSIMVNGVSAAADEVARGEGLSFAGAAALFPPLREGRPVHPSFIGRWAWHGVKTDDGRTVKLEAVRCGVRWLTARAAVARFIRDQQAPAEVVPAAADRRPSNREQAVERELAEMGV